MHKKPDDRGMTNNISRLAIEMEKILNRKKCKKKAKNAMRLREDGWCDTIDKKKIVKKMFEKKKRMDIRDRDIKSRYLLIIYRGMLQVGFSIQAKWEENFDEDYRTMWWNK